MPPQIIFDIAEVREYGVKKYKDPENWKRVEKARYVTRCSGTCLCGLQAHIPATGKAGSAI